MWWLGQKTQYLPEPLGPSVPGMMDVMLNYSKDGVLMRFYYPTKYKKQPGMSMNYNCSWVPNNSYIIGFARVLMTFTIFLRLALWWAGSCHIPAIFGARPQIPKGGKLQPIIISHGLGGHRWLYSNTCCELASRGFLVVALEHRDNSACHTFYYKSEEDARRDIQTPIDYKVVKFGKEHFERRHSQVTYRSDECCRVLDFLIGLNEGRVPVNVMDSNRGDFKLEDFVGGLDVDHVTMGGHSFGGAAALLSLARRKEFKQGILLDPWMFPIKSEHLHRRVDQPLLFVNTQTFHIATNVKAMAKFMDRDNRRMCTILHTTHETQTDTVLLLGYWLNWFMKKLPAHVGLKINNFLILNFLDETVGCPESVRDCKDYVERQRENIDYGLTRPWA